MMKGYDIYYWLLNLNLPIMSAEKNEVLQNIKQRMLEVRKYLGKSQRELGEEVGFESFGGQAIISKLENKGSASMASFYQIAQYFFKKGINLNYLFCESSEEVPMLNAGGDVPNFILRISEKLATQEEQMRSSIVIHQGLADQLATIRQTIDNEVATNEKDDLSADLLEEDDTLDY